MLVRARPWENCCALEANPEPKLKSFLSVSRASVSTASAKGPGAEGAEVEIENVRKVFHSRRGEPPVEALRDVTLRLPPGRFVAVLGPSGCGKSTLLALVAGLEKPTVGAIFIDGLKVVEPFTEVGIVFQRDLLLEWRTCLDNVLLQFELRGLPKRRFTDRAMELLDLVGISDFAARYPRELSGGMRQRVSLCRALAHDPDLLLMDEPFGALDALTRERLNDDLARISSKANKTVLFITHSIAEAIFLADKVVVLSNRPGRILEQFDIGLERPRYRELRDTPQFGKYIRDIRRVLDSEEAMSHEH